MPIFTFANGSAMKIANPIYDVVFRYLMKDEKVAKLILSTLIEEEIETLSFKTTEIPIDPRRHFLDIDEKEYPKKYQQVIRRLKTAMSDSKIVAQMKAEDDFIDVLKHQERELERAHELAEEERRQKEEERRQKEEAETREREERRKRKETQLKLAQKMLQYGESIAAIMAETGLSEAEIQQLIK